jgi:L-serine dehydratase
MNKKVRVLSIFDILGPIMVGPSSNHTAGAVRIGNMARMIFGEFPVSIVLNFYSSLAETYKGHMTDSAVVAGILGMDIDDRRIPVSLEMAREKNIKIKISTQTKSNKNPNTIDIIMESDSNKMKISSISVGGGEILISKINEFKVNFYGNNNLLIVIHQKDRNPVERIENFLKEKISFSKTIFGDKNNLSYFYLDSDLSNQEITKIRKMDTVILVRVLESLYFYKLQNKEPLFSNVSEVLDLCNKFQRPLPEIIIQYESKRSGLSKIEIRNQMKNILKAMKEEIDQGLYKENKLIGGIMDGRDAKRMYQSYLSGKTLSGKLIPLAIARSLACSEVNASLGRVVAAPTAGAVGVIPGILLTMAEKLNSSEENIIDALLVCAVIGLLIANIAPLSGAMGGCQSEVGVASAMAAGGLVQLAGGNDGQVFQAMAMAIKNLLGLICDTVAGPVEVPCIKRNIIGVVNAIAVAEMAMAGIESMIPPDEVISALHNVQKLMPIELRDTTLGGLGSTKTAKRLKREWLEKIK